MTRGDPMSRIDIPGTKCTRRSTELLDRLKTAVGNAQEISYSASTPGLRVLRAQKIQVQRALWNVWKRDYIIRIS